MSVKLTLTLDEQVYAIASGVFPDGAAWLKVTGALPIISAGVVPRMSDAHSGDGNA